MLSVLLTPHTHLSLSTYDFLLRYPMLMTNQTMTGLTVLCWVVAHIFPGIATINFAMMPFCGPNQIIHAFCETMSLTPLVCGDPSQQFSAAYTGAMIILYVPLAFIVFSYTCIIISILRMTSGQVSPWCTSANMQHHYS